MKKFVLLLCVFAVLMSAGAALAAASGGPVMVAKLVGDFLYNPFKPEAEYGGAPVNVKGRIALVGIDRETEKPAITFNHQDGSGQTWQVKCLVSKEDPMLMKVGRGDTITIQGTLSGFEDTVITIQDCKISQ